MEKSRTRVRLFSISTMLAAVFRTKNAAPDGESAPDLRLSVAAPLAVIHRLSASRPIIPFVQNGQKPERRG